MTALARYARLEAPARYHDGWSARPVPVMVSFGARSLVIMGFDGVAMAHWPLASLRAISARGERVAQLLPDPDSDERLVLEDTEMISAIEAVCPNLRHRPVDRRGAGRAVVWGIAALGAVLAMVFVILPLMAAQLATMIPPRQEQRLGDAVVGQIAELLALDRSGGGGLFCQDPRGIRALDRLTARLEAGVSLPYPLRVSVIDHPMVNALATPGGRVLLFRGLIEQADSAEEVAGVLAHEIAHVVHRDPTIGVLRNAGTAGILGLLVGDVLGASAVVVATEALLNARHLREVEQRADETAYTILARAGLPTDPFAGFFTRMARETGQTPALLAYLSSHPALEDRAARAEAAGEAAPGNRFEPALSDGDWIALGQICTARAKAPRRGPAQASR